MRDLPHEITQLLLPGFRIGELIYVRTVLLLVCACWA